MTAADFDTGAVILGGVRTRAITTPGHGPTILLFHGFTDSADTWRPLLAEFAQRGHRAVALDLPHFGRADRPTTDSVLACFDAFVRAAVRHYDRGAGVVLVGNSVGGLAVLRASQGREPSVRAVVAIGPAGLITPGWTRIVHRAGPLLRAMLWLPLPPVTLCGRLLPTLWSEMFCRAVTVGGMSIDAKRRYAAHIRRGDVRRVALLGGRALRELVAPNVIDPGQIAIPVTVVWGGRDWVCPPSGACTIRETRQVSVIVYPDAGHCAQHDKPREIADLVASTAAAHTRVEHITEGAS